MEEKKSTEEEEVEGIDGHQTSEGWGEYPLDSVFVRTEQRTVGEVVKRINAGRFDLNPEFQRDFLWDVVKQSRLIESCLMRIPLPVLYVAEAKDGRIIVVDGLQRLTTFKRYLGNEFKLDLDQNDEDEGPSNPLSSQRFEDLPTNLQERIEDTQLTLYILDAKAPERAKLDIFERVNGGVPLTRQQMRNCLYSGAATRWLKDAAENIDFLTATGRSLDPKKMRDREAVNRFCAFYLLGEKEYKGSDMDGFLAKALEVMNEMSDEERRNLMQTFLRSMRVNKDLFGRHAFRKSLAAGNNNAGRSVLNIALFEVLSVILASAESSDADEIERTFRRPILTLMGDGEFVNAISYSTNSTKQVFTRFKKARAVIGGSI